MKFLLIAILAVCLMYATTSRALASVAVAGESSTPAYWIKLTADADKELLTKDQIQEINQKIASSGLNVHTLTQLPESYTAGELQVLITKASQGVIADGQPMPEDIYCGKSLLTQEKWNTIINNCNIDALPKVSSVRYGVTVQRGNVRLLPTSDGFFENDTEMQTHYDNLQGTAIDPAEAVAVLADSADKKFSFVMTRNYMGWLDNSVIALADKDSWLKYAEPKEYASATDNKTYLQYENETHLYQMGARIPLENNELQLPKKENGQLSITKITFSDKIPGLTKGSLPFTKANIIKQSFKFLNDEYGWGGQDNSVDCSSFVGDVYRSMGIDLPRDADKQEKSFTRSIEFAGLDHDSRMDYLKTAPAGTLLFTKGHVMLYLGINSNNVPMLIHAASSFHEYGHRSYIRQVIVSEATYASQHDKPIVDSLTSIGSMEK